MDLSSSCKISYTIYPSCSTSTAFTKPRCRPTRHFSVLISGCSDATGAALRRSKSFLISGRSDATGAALRRSKYFLKSMSMLSPYRILTEADHVASALLYPQHLHSCTQLAAPSRRSAPIQQTCVMYASSTPRHKICTKIAPNVVQFILLELFVCGSNQFFIMKLSQNIHAKFCLNEQGYLSSLLL